MQDTKYLPITEHYRALQSRHLGAEAYVYGYNNETTDQHGITMVPLVELTALDKVIIAYAPKLLKIELSDTDVHQIRQGLTDLSANEVVELTQWREEKI